MLSMHLKCNGGWIILIATVYIFSFHPLLSLSSTRSECVCILGSQFRRGAGVLDMVFESPFQLFTCGYDTFIRLWDLRLSPRYVTISLLSGTTQTVSALDTNKSPTSFEYAAVNLFFNQWSSCILCSSVCQWIWDLLNRETYCASAV